jgi:hypothetical protein
MIEKISHLSSIVVLTRYMYLIIVTRYGWREIISDKHLCIAAIEHTQIYDKPACITKTLMIFVQQ